MKETVSTMTLFKIIIVFTFLFAAFLSVAILYNKVYKLKNQTISIIEKYEGVTDKSTPIIISFLNSTNYKDMKLIRPLYYMINNELAYKFKNEYFFGSELLVAPITSKSNKITCLYSRWIKKRRNNYKSIY